MIEVKDKFSITPLPDEIWVDVIGHEGLYMVSNFSRVLSLERNFNSGRYKIVKKIEKKIMRTYLSSAGYPFLRLSKNGKKTQFLLHRLVAIHFIPNPNNYPCINHKNNIRDDSSIDNLEWCTYSYNTEYSFRVMGRVQKSGKDDELSRPFIGKNNTTNKETIFYSQRDAAKALETCQASIWRALHSKKILRNFTFSFIKL